MATVNTITFSEFAAGGPLENGDLPVGLRGGVNTQFDFESENEYLPPPLIIVNGASVQMVTNTSYLANSSGLCTLSLPITAAFGDTLQIGGFGSGGWAIQQGSSQQVRIGYVASTLGTSGSVSSANQYDSINLTCIVPNQVWLAFVPPQSAGLIIL